jgi:putative ABC transport system permease protein
MRPLSHFLRLFAAFSLRPLTAHRWRALAVVAGIGLGAAVFTSVRLSVHASLSAFTRSMDRIAGSAEAVVTRPGERVPEELVADLLRLPMVASAAPLLTTYVRVGSKAAEPFLLIGLDPLLDRPLRAWRVEARPAAGAGPAAWLTLMRDPFTLLAAAPLAHALGWRAGDTVTLESAHRRADFRVAGVLAREALATAEAGRLAIVDIATFQEFTGTFGQVDRIDLTFTGDKAAASAALASRLPPGVRLNPPAELRAAGQGLIRAYELNLSILSFVSLFVGMFLVYSLVALNAASRRRELAVLRALGAEAGSIFRLFLAEGAFLGLVGWLVSLPICVLLVPLLLDGVTRTIATLFVRVRVEGLSLSAWEVVLSLGLTVGVALAAAWQPAREAMAVEPSEALAAEPGAPGPAHGTRRLALVGLGAVAAFVPLSRLPGVGGVPWPGYGAALLLFAGFALLAPWALRHTGMGLAPRLRRWAGLPAYLAARTLTESGKRTAISVGALITAVALFTALVVMTHSFRRTVERWVAQTLSGDLFLTGRMAEINRRWEPLPPEVLEGLAHLPWEADLTPNRRFALQREGFPYQLEFMDLAAFARHGEFLWHRGRPEGIWPALSEGRGVAVSEVFANRTGLGVGDTYAEAVEGVRLSLPILGVVRDYRTQGGVVFADFQAAARAGGDVAWGGVRIHLRGPQAVDEAAVAALENHIRTTFGARLDTIPGRRLRQAVLEIFDETFAVTSVLLVIALVVAGLGIATTLAVTVLERGRQLNTLYAIGASYGQIRRMIVWEAVLMVAVGEVLGLASGFLLSYLLVFVINRQSFGWTFVYGLDAGSLLISLPLILATAVAAALPAIRLVYAEPPARASEGRQ